MGGFAALLLLAGCAGQAVAIDSCTAELAAIAIADSIDVDVERLVPDLVNRQGLEPYWSDIPSLATACRPPARLPDQYVLFGVDEARAYVKAVALVRTKEMSGVVFAYGSVGAEETQTGLAAALVEYRPDGAPRQIYKASEFLAGEGRSRLTRSTITAESIERCTQEIEYAIYSENGDITGELHVPRRQPLGCEHIVQFDVG